MPQWAGSCWYYLRFADARNEEHFIDKAKDSSWMPVDTYIGGIEHATRHLIYARFWHKFLYDNKLLSTNEPFEKLHTVGIVQAEGGGKMSKRMGNVIDPLDVAESVGIDAVRLYMAFMAPFSQTVSFNSEQIAGPRRFIERLFAMKENLTKGIPSKHIEALESKTIQKVTNDIEMFKFNTAVSTIMIFLNELSKEKKVSRKCYETLVVLSAPFIPFVTEEIWHLLGNDSSVHLAKWPKPSGVYIEEKDIEVVVQVQGKVRGSVTAPNGSSQMEIEGRIEKDPELSLKTSNFSVKAYIPAKLISFG